MTRLWLCGAAVVILGLATNLGRTEPGKAESGSAQPSKTAPAKSVAAADDCRSAEEAAEDRIEAALRKQVSLEFVETPLADVVNVLRDQHGIEIQLDKVNLEASGVNSDTPCSLQLQNVTLKSALRRLLDDLKLTWVIRDEVLLITTEEEATSKPVLKFYPVRDLAAASANEMVTDDHAANCDELIDLITTTVFPDSWDTGGGSGGIRAIPRFDLLGVSTRQDIHDEVERFLCKLRAARKAQDAAAAVTAQPNAPIDDKTPVVRVYAISPLLTAFGAKGTGDEHSASIAGRVEKAIRTTIEPKSWDTAGGAGAVQVVGGSVVVRQTPAVQRQVVKLLAAMEHAEAKNAAPILGSGTFGGGFF